MLSPTSQPIRWNFFHSRFHALKAGYEFQWKDFIGSFENVLLSDWLSKEYLKTKLCMAYLAIVNGIFEEIV